VEVSIRMLYIGLRTPNSPEILGDN
jgi:hypothetical protein